MADEKTATSTRLERRPLTGLLLESRYRLGARIGSGGTGDVYRARDLRLGRHVAVKVIQGAPQGSTRRFEGEARMLAGFVHPNLVRVLDAGEHEGQWYLVMELIDGESLASRLARGPLPPALTAKVGSGLASALAYVHERGVVHRDVKPANILLDRSGWVWLADFGIARIVDGAAMTATGMVAGTLAYLAPEQAEGQLVEPPADIYALGLVLLECLTGERAFSGTPSEITAARLTRGLVVPPYLDSGWASVIRTMTARAPANRPNATAVSGFLATMRTARERPAPAPVATDVTPLDGHPAVRRPHRRPAVVSGLPRRIGAGAAQGAGRSARLARRHPVRSFALLVMALVVVTALLLGAGNGSFAMTSSIVDPGRVPVSTEEAAAMVVRAVDTGVHDGEISPQTAHVIVAQLLASGAAFGWSVPPLDLFVLAGTVRSDLEQGKIRGAAAPAVASAVELLGMTLGLRVTLPLPRSPAAARPYAAPARPAVTVTPTTAAPAPARTLPATTAPANSTPGRGRPVGREHHHGSRPRQGN